MNGPEMALTGAEVDRSRLNSLRDPLVRYWHILEVPPPANDGRLREYLQRRRP
jgi:hypothetical protein